VPTPQDGRPGVTLVVMAHTSPDSHDPFVPRVPGLQLKKLYEFLLPHMPPGVTLTVTHPEWECLDIEGYLEWVPETQVAAAMEQLRVQLRRYLSPWYAGADVAPETLTQEGVFAFIKAQSQVVNVHGFALYRRDLTTGMRAQMDGEILPVSPTHALIPGRMLDTETEL